MKKNGLFFCMVFILCVIYSTATAADWVYPNKYGFKTGKCGENLTWVFDDQGLLTISGTGQMSDYGYSSGFAYNAGSVRKVIIEDGVTTIGKNAFANTYLEVVILPDSVVSIGEGAFKHRTPYVLLGDYVEAIGSQAFYATYSNSNRIFCHKNSLTDYTLLDCNIAHTYIEDADPDIIRQVFLAKSVEIIVGNQMSLYAFSFPDWDNPTIIWQSSDDSIVSVANGVITGNKPGVATITASIGAKSASCIVSCYASCGENVFWTLDHQGKITISGTGDMYIFDSEELAPWYEFRESIHSVEIQNGVTNIGNRAFYDYDNIQSITMANTVLTIGEAAFYSCDNLSDIRFSTALTDIGESAFGGCSNLSFINLPGGLENIGRMAFTSCNISNIEVFGSKETVIWHFFYPANDEGNKESLYHIVLPASIIQVGEGAFCCNPLSHDNPDMILPDGLTTIQSQAFYGTDMHFIWLSDSIKTIESAAFADCKNLKYVRIPNSIESIDSDAFPPGIIILGYSRYDNMCYAETYANDLEFVFVNYFDPFGGDG